MTQERFILRLHEKNISFDTAKKLYVQHEDLIKKAENVSVNDAEDLLAWYIEQGYDTTDFLISLLDNYKSSDEFVEYNVNRDNEFYIGNGMYFRIEECELPYSF